MCGVIGIVSKNPVNQALYDGLTVMQHRGQDAAGIVTWGEEGLKQRKANGLVRDVFRTRHMLRLSGNIGVGHVRYPTAGGSKSAEAQPFYVNSPYGICLAHNGNLTNHAELADLLIREDRRHLSTDSDSEVLLNVPRHTEPKNAPAASTAIKSADRRLMRGAPTPLEAGEKTTTPPRRCESLTRPTYS